MKSNFKKGEKMKVREKMLTFLLLIMAASTTVFAATGPFEAFKGSFIEQAQNYVLPVLIMITIIAAGVTYMKTKDWIISLVTGGISTAIIGGAVTLATKFSDFNIS